MNCKNIFSLAMTGLVLGWTVFAAIPADAESSGATAAASTETAAETVPYPELGEIRTFEVRSFEPQDYSTTRDEVPPEMPEYARSALLNDIRFRYASPGEGLLRFSCAGFFCHRIRAEVTLGENGPVVWKTERLYRKFFMVTDPDTRRFARSVVEQLGADYANSLQAVPEKIQIKED